MNKYLIGILTILSFNLFSYEFVGKHYIASFIECDSNALLDTKALRKAMKRAVESAGAKILQTSHHNFDQGGYTLTILLSESHASIHTYPEHEACFIDLFTCGEICCWVWFEEEMKKYLKPKFVLNEVIERSEEGNYLK